MIGTSPPTWQSKTALDGHLLPGLSPLGVPRELRGTALPFRYNRLDDLQAIVDMHGSDLAAIVMEPVRGHEPAPGFLAAVRDTAEGAGAVLVFDEVTSGLRLNTGGVHLTYGVHPDVAVFAKALGNGFPMPAVIGIGAVMGEAQRSFVSSSYWTERVGPAAALATLRQRRLFRSRGPSRRDRCPSPGRMERCGSTRRAYLWRSAVSLRSAISASTRTGRRQRHCSRN